MRGLGRQLAHVPTDADLRMVHALGNAQLARLFVTVPLLRTS
jgi:hypothetical protein